MASTGPEKLLDLLDVHLEAFAMCEIDRHCAMACPASDSLIVHFVLEGQGAIECEHGRYELRRGCVLIVPRNLAKRIEGPAPILTVVDLADACPLAPGFVKFRASASGLPGLVLGCGSISVGVRGAPRLFDNLDRPLMEQCEGGPLPLLFEAIAVELRSPGAGTKQMVEALMKLILVAVIRSHLARQSEGPSLEIMFGNPQLVRAVAAIAAMPADSHSVDSLAALAGMSRSCFNRQFSASYGCSPMEFVQAVRLRAAARMLAGSDMPVKLIAAAVGYASRSHFSRAFTARFGDDPSRYRHGREPSEPAPSEPAAAPL
jgi:AraC-like DNA-binding protein